MPNNVSPDDVKWTMATAKRFGKDNRQSVGVIRAAALYTHILRRDHEEKRLKEVNKELSDRKEVIPAQRQNNWH